MPNYLFIIETSTRSVCLCVCVAFALCNINFGPKLFNYSTFKVYKRTRYYCFPFDLLLLIVFVLCCICFFYVMPSIKKNLSIAYNTAIACYFCTPLTDKLNVRMECRSCGLSAENTSSICSTCHVIRRKNAK